VRDWVALMLRHLLNTFLWLTADDQPVFVGVPVFLTCLGLLACFRPARRATKVDSMAALRHE